MPHPPILPCYTISPSLTYYNNKSLPYPPVIPPIIAVIFNNKRRMRVPSRRARPDLGR
jgi:hypothetical protein